MKYSSRISKTLLIALGFIVLIAPQRAFGENPLIKASKELTSNHFYIRAWSVLPNDDIVLSLSFNDKSKLLGGYNAYARLNSRGEFVVGPDSIFSRHWGEPVGETIVFDSSGTLYIYRDHHHRGTVFRDSYSPSLGQMEEIELSKYLLGSIKSVSNLPGIGNVIFSISRHGMPYKITIDNPEDTTIQIFDFDKIEGFNSFNFSIVIHKISDTRILFIGKTAALEDSDGLYQVSKFVFDLENQDIKLAEVISHNELLSANSFKHSIPAQKQSVIFERSGNVFYLAPENSGDGENTHFFIELDSDGNFVLDDTKAPLQIEESALVDMPDDFLIFYNRHIARYFEKNKFWMMSLDNFPTLVIDKGE